MARYILDVNQEWGTTIILIEHDMARGDGHLRPGRRARSRPQDRRRHPRRGAARPGRDPAPISAAPSAPRRPNDRRRDRRDRPTTLPQLLRRNAATMAGRPAIREKDRGIWQTFSWAALLERGARLRARPRRRRLRPRRQAAVIGDNRPRLYWAQLAAQASAASRCRSTRTRSPPSWSTCSNHAEISVVVAEDQEQVDKILSLQGRGCRISTLVVYDDPRGMRQLPTSRCSNRSSGAGGGPRVRRGASGLSRARDRRRARPTMWRCSPTPREPPGSPRA